MKLLLLVIFLVYVVLIVSIGLAIAFKSLGLIIFFSIVFFIVLFFFTFYLSLYLVNVIFEKKLKKLELNAKLTNLINAYKLSVLFNYVKTKLSTTLASFMIMKKDFAYAQKVLSLVDVTKIKDKTNLLNYFLCHIELAMAKKDTKNFENNVSRLKSIIETNPEVISLLDNYNVVLNLLEGIEVDELKLQNSADYFYNVYLKEDSNLNKLFYLFVKSYTKDFTSEDSEEYINLSKDTFLEHTSLLTQY